MSRTKNIKRNLVFNTLKYVIQILSQFVLRTILIYVMGTEYVGLNGLFTNIFAFLNLAELGIGSAIVFSMYKPIEENDVDKVKALQQLYKKFYLIISIVVAALGLILMPFIKVFIKGDVQADINIYLLFGLYLFNTIIGYFSAHKRSLLFAHQRNDVESKVKTFCLIGMSVIQIAVLVIFKNYYIYFAANIFFTILENILIHVWANKLYPQINGKAENKLDALTKKEITKNVTALSFHKIGGVMVFSTDNIIISSLFGVVLLGCYSNYYIIISALNAIFMLLINSLTGSVGNLIASKDKQYNYEKFKQINFLLNMFTAFSTVCMLVLFQPFMSAWLGADLLLNYSTVILICISFYLSRMREGVGVFKNAAGLFWQNKFSPLVESTINIAASIGLGLLMGIDGVVLGTILSTLFVPFWVEPKVLFKHYFNKKQTEFYLSYLWNTICTLITAALCHLSCMLIPSCGIWFLMLKFIVCGLVCIISLILLNCFRKEFKTLVLKLKRKK